MRALHDRGFCSRLRRNLIKLRSLLEVNNEILVNFNEEIGHKHHCVLVSL